MSYTNITALPPAPQRGQPGETFVTLANAWVSDLARWTTDVNTRGAYFDSVASAVTADKVYIDGRKAQIDATASNTDALSASAIGAANFKGNWGSLSGALNIPASVAHNGSMWVLLANTSNVASIEPTMISSSWLRVSTPNVRYLDDPNRLLCLSEFTANNNALGSTNNIVRIEELGMFIGANCYSYDGINWNTQTGLPTFLDYNYPYDSARGILCSTATNFYRSTDGINWSLAEGAPPFSGTSFTYFIKETGLYVMLNGATETSTNKVATSTDGITWTIRPVPSTAGIAFALEYSPELGIYVVCGQNFFATSTDGINWTSRTAFTSSGVYKVAYSPSLQRFVVTPLNSSAFWYSNNGIDWLSKTVASHTGIYTLNWCDSIKQFVTVSSDKLIYSDDGINWNIQTVPSFGTGSKRSTAWSNDLNLLICNTTTQTFHSRITGSKGMQNTFQGNLKGLTSHAVEQGRALSLRKDGMLEYASFGVGNSEQVLPAESITGIETFEIDDDRMGVIYTRASQQRMKILKYNPHTSGFGFGLSATGQVSRQWFDVTVNPNNNDVYAVLYGESIFKQTAGVGNFISLNQTARQWRAIAINSNNNDVYAVVNGGDIYKQTAGVGNFISLNQTAREWRGIVVNPTNNDVYATTLDGIYKQTGGTGNFISLNQTAREWRLMAINHANNDVYAVVYGGDIYKQTAGVGDFIALNQTSRIWHGIAINQHTNDVYATVDNGDIYKQSGGVGDYIALNQNSRRWISISINSNTNSVYSCVYDGDIYQGTLSEGNEITISTMNSVKHKGVCVNNKQILVSYFDTTNTVRSRVVPYNGVVLGTLGAETAQITDCASIVGVVNQLNTQDNFRCSTVVQGLTTPNRNVRGLHQIVNSDNTITVGSSVTHINNDVATAAYIAKLPTSSGYVVAQGNTLRHVSLFNALLTNNVLKTDLSLATANILPTTSNDYIIQINNSTPKLIRFTGTTVATEINASDDSINSIPAANVVCRDNLIFGIKTTANNTGFLARVDLQAERIIQLQNGIHSPSAGSISAGYSSLQLMGNKACYVRTPVSGSGVSASRYEVMDNFAGIAETNTPSRMGSTTCIINGLVKVPFSKRGSSLYLGNNGYLVTAPYFYWQSPVGTGKDDFNAIIK